MNNWAQSFREAYCQQAGCRDSDYPTRLFRQILYRHALLVASGLRLIKPEHFAIDEELVEMAGNARNWDEFNQAIESHAFSNKLRGGFMRRQLRLRVSGQRLSRIVARLMGSHPRGDGYSRRR